MSSVWNFCSPSSDVISQGKQWWCREKSLKVHNLKKLRIDRFFRFSGALPMSVVCDGSPTQPSIADLLEWLNDLERIHNELYLKN